MSTHAYTEDQLVEQPAIGLFAELAWQTMSVTIIYFLNSLLSMRDQVTCS